MGGGCPGKAFMCNAVRVHLFSTQFLQQKENGEQDFCVLVHSRVFVPDYSGTERKMKLCIFWGGRRVPVLQHKSTAEEATMKTTSKKGIKNKLNIVVFNCINK